MWASCLVACHVGPALVLIHTPLSTHVHVVCRWDNVTSRSGPDGKRLATRKLFACVNQDERIAACHKGTHSGALRPKWLVHTVQALLGSRSLLKERIYDANDYLYTQSSAHEAKAGQLLTKNGPIQWFLHLSRIFSAQARRLICSG